MIRRHIASAWRGQKFISKLTSPVKLTRQMRAGVPATIASRMAMNGNASLPMSIETPSASRTSRAFGPQMVGEATLKTIAMLYSQMMTAFLYLNTHTLETATVQKSNLSHNAFLRDKARASTPAPVHRLRARCAARTADERRIGSRVLTHMSALHRPPAGTRSCSTVSPGRCASGRA